MNKQITVAELVELLEEIAPSQLAEDWDNVGLMLGRRSKAVHKIMLALDMTAETVAQAVAFKAMPTGSRSCFCSWRSMVSLCIALTLIWTASLMVSTIAW